MEQDFFVHHGIVSAVKRVQFFSDMVSYIVLRGRWCNIIILNVHAPSEEKSDDSKAVFMWNWSRFLIIFLKILLEDFNVKVGRKNIFKPIIGNDSLHQGSNDNGVRTVNFATSKNLVKSMMLLH